MLTTYQRQALYARLRLYQPIYSQHEADRVHPNWGYNSTHLARRARSDSIRAVQLRGEAVLELSYDPSVVSDAAYAEEQADILAIASLYRDPRYNARRA